MTDQTPAEQLRATAARLREALGVKPVARRVERTFVAICTNHGAGLVCFNCAYFDAEDETLAELIVSLLNARLPLANWLEVTAVLWQQAGPEPRNAFGYSRALALAQALK